MVRRTQFDHLSTVHVEYNKIIFEHLCPGPSTIACQNIDVVVRVGPVCEKVVRLHPQFLLSPENKLENALVGHFKCNCTNSLKPHMYVNTGRNPCLSAVVAQ